MSKDNREECRDCNGTGIIYQDEMLRYIGTQTCDRCRGTGKVTIDSGADVCEWRYVVINREYIPSCSNMRGLPSITGFKVCPYCTRPITIKGE